MQNQLVGVGNRVFISVLPEVVLSFGCDECGDCPPRNLNDIGLRDLPLVLSGEEVSIGYDSP